MGVVYKTTRPKIYRKKTRPLEGLNMSLISAYRLEKSSISTVATISLKSIKPSGVPRLGFCQTIEFIRAPVSINKIPSKEHRPKSFPRRSSKTCTESSGVKVELIPLVSTAVKN